MKALFSSVLISVFLFPASAAYAIEAGSSESIRDCAGLSGLEKNRCIKKHQRMKRRGRSGQAWKDEREMRCIGQRGRTQLSCIRSNNTRSINRLRSFRYFGQRESTKRLFRSRTRFRLEEKHTFCRQNPGDRTCPSRVRRPVEE